jgi:hypothetical protein
LFQFDLNEVQLLGCTLDEDTTPIETEPTHVPEEHEDLAKPVDLPKDEPKRTGQKSNVRPSGSCALPLEPHGEREDVRGLRFGVHPSSRVEFPTLPGSIENNLIITLELRSNSANGIVLFISNEKQTDHIALYILDGKVCLSYGSGNARVN